MTPDDKLQKLIALKRYEQPREGYFDEFLSEFQQRQREELLKRSSMSLFAERAGTFFKEFGMSRWVLGAGVAYATLMIGFVLWKNQPKELSHPAKLAPASYQGNWNERRQGIPVVDFENGKGYRKADSRRTFRREF